MNNIAGITEEDLENLIESLKQAQEYFERARSVAETYISIDPPWDYDPSDYSPGEDAHIVSFRWSYEGHEHLREQEDDDLEILADRIEEGEDAVVEELEGGNKPYKGLYLLISSLDSLIIWLCKTDPDISADHTNPGDEGIYFGPTKKTALENWYDEYAIFGVEDDDGSEFKQKWDDFWYHRHYIMHGSADAHYDRNIVIATLFYVGLVSHVVADRAEELDSEE